MDNLLSDNKKLVMRLFEGFGAGNIKQILDCLDADATWWVSGTLSISKTYTKNELEKLFLNMFDLCVGPIKFIGAEFTEEGNRVAVETESLAQTKTGRTYKNLYHFLFEVRNGKLLRIKEYMDPMHVNSVFFAP